MCQPITKTGLFQVGDVTVGGPTGVGLSGGEVIHIKCMV